MKGNMFLGYARGSVGDVVFTRSMGQQQGRARNRKPNNPRSGGQMKQRALFANAVKFHTRGVQQLFKFAFEDKRSNESDYNAFMRHNMSAGVRISKQASASPVYPAVGSWQMSCGSLRELKLVKIEESNIYKLSVPSITSNDTTLAKLTAALKSDYGLQEGDWLTLVNIIEVGATSDNCPSIDPNESLQGSQWNLYQITLSSSDTSSLPSWIEADNGFITISYANSATDMYAQGACVIASRKTSTGLLVSSSFLTGNSTWASIIQKSKEPDYEELVLQSWATTEDAILEGGLNP